MLGMGSRVVVRLDSLERLPSFLAAANFRGSEGRQANHKERLDKAKIS